MIDDFFQLGKLTSLGLVLLLPLANPLTSMSMLLSLGQYIPPKERNRQIREAAGYVFGIMLVTYYAGAWIMNTFGISIPGLRIAGGLIVAVLGFGMLFPKEPGQGPAEAGGLQDKAHRGTPNIAFVPLALPGTAGPGTIAMIISVAASVESGAAGYSAWVVNVAPVLVFGLLGWLFWICLRSADRIVALIGKDGVEAISRIMGFLLVCMGVQFVINGVLEVVRDYAVHG